MQGLVDRIRKTNPFGGGDDKKKAKAEKPKDIGDQLRAALGGTRKVKRGG